MRGLEEIIASNNDPAAHHRSREPQHGHYDDGTDNSRSFESNLRDRRREQQRVHGERVEARQAERNRVEADHEFDRAGDEIASNAEDKARDAFFALLLLDIIAHAVLSGKKIKEPDHQERIHSAIDQAADSPFMKFWAAFNKVFVEEGLPEAPYGVAKHAFEQYQADIADATFPSTHELEDPTTRFKADGVYQGLPIYRGEFLDNGGEWRRVYNSTGPLAYATPEAAIAGAKFARSLASSTKNDG